MWTEMKNIYTGEGENARRTDDNSRAHIFVSHCDTVSLIFCKQVFSIFMSSCCKYLTIHIF